MGLGGHRSLDCCHWCCSVWQSLQLASVFGNCYDGRTKEKHVVKKYRIVYKGGIGGIVEMFILFASVIGLPIAVLLLPTMYEIVESCPNRS